MDAEVTLRLLERAPHDLVAGRELLASLDGRPLTPEQAQRRARILEEQATERARRAAQHWAAARMAGEQLRDAGDLAAMRAALLSWPDELQGTPQEGEAHRLAQEWEDAALGPARDLVAALQRAEGGWSESSPPTVPEAEAWQEKTRAALTRRSFPTEVRQELEGLAARLPAWAERARRRAGEALVRERLERLLGADVRTRAARLHELVDDPALNATDTSAAAAALLKKSEQVEAILARKARAFEVRATARIVAGELRLERVDPNLGASVLFAPGFTAWDAAHPWAPDLDELTVITRDGDAVRAWLFVRGLPGGVAPPEWPAIPAPPPPPSLFWERLRAWLAMALRRPGGVVPDVESDPALTAWCEAARGRGTPPHRGAKSQLERARVLYLADDPAAAWAAISAAERDLPGDGETALLASMQLRQAAGVLPQRGVLLLAFAQARRAWDLEPGLRQAALRVGEVGLELLDSAPDTLRVPLLPVVQAASEEVLRQGQEQAAICAFLGEQWLGQARGGEALRLLRTANARWPKEHVVLLVLARAEVQTGERSRALKCLEQARDAMGQGFPTWATELLRQLKASEAR